jgi:benzoyl-CoA reductase/2-hydroxyglutaryl-CoA dehydratase subunit BcrC/BadD/HgdB
MDSRWGEYPHYLPERVEFFGGQLDKLFSAVEKVIGVEVTRSVWDKAMTSRNHFARSIDQLQQYMKADPMPLSSVELYLAMMFGAATTERAAVEGPEAVDTLCQEIKERIDKGEGVVEKGAPRVMTSILSLSDPSIMHMVEDAGLAMLPMTGGLSSQEMLAPTHATLGAYIADLHLMGGGYHSSYGMVRLMDSMVKAPSVDGFIWAYTYNCRPMAQTSHFLTRYIRDNTGIPVLSIESDHFDSRSYSAAALRTRVESFAELLRARKTYNV